MVSIIMSVYNTEHSMLCEAIESILNQTYEDYEFLIYDDCSTNDIDNIIEKYVQQDNRIVFKKNNINLGLTKTLNLGLKEAKGEYIARIDADDICKKDRLLEQVNYLDAHTNIAIVGSEFLCFDKKSSYQVLLPWKNPTEIATALFFTNVFPHSSIMIRNQFLKEFNLTYDENYRYAQDYNLYVRILEHAKIGIISKPLVEIRRSDSQITSRYSTEQKKYQNLTRLLFLERMKINFSEDEGNTHCSLCDGLYSVSLNQTAIWVKKIEKGISGYEDFCKDVFNAFIIKCLCSIMKQAFAKDFIKTIKFLLKRKNRQDIMIYKIIMNFIKRQIGIA